MKLRSILERGSTNSTNGLFDDYDQSEEEEEIDDPSIIAQAISFIESEHVSILKKKKKRRKKKKMVGDRERETTNENQKEELEQEEEEEEGSQIQKLIGFSFFSLIF